MDTAYYFMFLALVVGYFGSLHSTKPPKFIALICGLTPICALSAVLIFQSEGNVFEAMALTVPFLIAIGVAYAALGYFGAILGEEKRIKRQDEKAGVKTIATRKRGGWWQLGAVFVFFLLIGLSDKLMIYLNQVIK